MASSSDPDTGTAQSSSQGHGAPVNVILTGTSRGLGAALFDALAARGDRLFAIGRRFTDDQQALAGSDPERIELHRADLAEVSQLPAPAHLQRFLAAHGPAPAVLLHNAAVVTPIGAVGALPPAPLATALTVNLTAPMLLTNTFLEVAPRPARIVFISSGAASRVVGGFAAYCAAKAGAEMFFNVVADQFRDDPDVTAVNVNPGQMDTGMQTDIRQAGAAGAYFPARQIYVDRHARGEMADATTVAQRIIAEHLS
ncbi:MAG TPA: SDR family NAD(P)-dependent oxidoreductase [Micromonosporaceae bacterium]|nr:SDR family NAD(P)-dependent oxidoreductase [Micromonosporaceae bacterium]